MKKLVSLMTVAVLAASVSFAQGIQDDIDRANAPKTNPAPRAERQRAPQQRNQPQKHTPQRTPQQRQQQEIETVTISGELKLEKGIVAIQSSDKTFFIPMLNRYIGFITGLQEGKTVSVEGFAGRNMLHPKKLTIDGKEYDFGRAVFAQGFKNQPQRQQYAPRHTPQLKREPYGTRHTPQHKFHTPQKNNRSREDRPNRENRPRRNIPQSSINSESLEV